MLTHPARAASGVHRYPLELIRVLIEHYDFGTHHALTRREGLTGLDAMLLTNPGSFVSQRFCAFELTQTWLAKLASQLAEDKASTKPAMFPLCGSLIAVTMQCCDLSNMIAGCGKSMVNILKVH